MGRPLGRPVDCLEGECAMEFETCVRCSELILMEGALGQRLKGEFHLAPHEWVALADMIYRPAGRKALEQLWGEYRDIAARYELPLLVTTPTRRADQARVQRSGYPDTIVRDNAAFLCRLREQWSGPVYVGGLMGCRGDAYTGMGALSESEALAFHRWQAEQFRQTEVDFLMAGIMPTVPEAAGMARAMAETGLPYLISFTIQEDGRLIDGAAISDAIEHIDGVAGTPPLGYMTNCVHPSILRRALAQPCNQTEQVRRRFLGVQANAAANTYVELERGVGLRPSKPKALAAEMAALREKYGLKLFGGCCGTDGTYLEAIARRLTRK